MAAWLLITLLLALEPNSAAITITVMADTSGPILVISQALACSHGNADIHTHTVDSCNLAEWMFLRCATLSHLLPSQYLRFRQEQNSA